MNAKLRVFKWSDCGIGSDYFIIVFLSDWCLRCCSCCRGWNCCCKKSENMVETKLFEIFKNFQLFSVSVVVVVVVVVVMNKK